MMLGRKDMPNMGNCLKEQDDDLNYYWVLSVVVVVVVVVSVTFLSFVFFPLRN